MAVESVKELHTQRQSRKSYGSDAKTEHRRVYRVITDDITDGSGVALAAAALPDPTERYLNVPLQDVDCQGQDDGFTYVVTYTYSTKSDDGGEGFEPNPLNRPPEVSGGFDNQTEPYQYDINGDPVSTSAGELLASALERETSEVSISISANESVSWVARYSFNNKINAASFSVDGVTIPAGLAKISGISGNKQSENVNGNNFNYWKNTYIVKVRPEGWDHLYDDRGLYELGPTSLPQRIKDIDGLDVTKPYPLDGSGAAAASATAIPATIIRKPYETISYSPLPFG